MTTASSSPPPFHPNKPPTENQELSQLLSLLHAFTTSSKASTTLIRGAVLEGAAGTGKTHLAKEAAQQTGLPYHYLSCICLFGSNRGDAERNLQTTFHECSRDSKKHMLILDDIEAIGKDRSRAQHMTDLSLLAMFLESFDRPELKSSVFVLGITGDASLLDASLLQPGRLEVTIRLTTPTLLERQALLEALLRKMGPAIGETEESSSSSSSPSSSSSMLLSFLTRRTRGFTGADLSHLCTEALATAWQRRHQHQQHNRDEEKDQSPPPSRGPQQQQIRIQQTDWEVALEKARPVGIPWAVPEAVQLTELAGVQDIIQLVTQAVLLPLSQPEALHAMGIPRASFGVLLHGEPGTGKSTLGRALATAAGPYASFLSIECPELVNKVVGESEQAVARLFAKARQAAPCILFLDHIEAIAGKRGFDTSSEQTMDRLLSTLLIEMDGLSGSSSSSPSSAASEEEGMIVVVAATNHLDMLDDAILRPGRLDLHVEMTLPDAAARAAIFEHHLARLPLSFVEEEMDEEKMVGQPSSFANLAELAQALARESQGLSGADIQGVCQEAALLSLRESLENIHVLPRHVLEALLVQGGGRGGRH